MSDKVKCKTHGEQAAAYVCQHIVGSMHSGIPVGFHWSREDDSQRPDAWCSSCEEARSQGSGEWTDELMEVVRVSVLCGACYDHAKDIWLRGHKVTQ
jgi:hypothetical protein